MHTKLEDRIGVAVRFRKGVEQCAVEVRNNQEGLIRERAAAKDAARTTIQLLEHRLSVIDEKKQERIVELESECAALKKQLPGGTAEDVEGLEQELAAAKEREVDYKKCYKGNHEALDEYEANSRVLNRQLVATEKENDELRKLLVTLCSELSWNDPLETIRERVADSVAHCDQERGEDLELTVDTKTVDMLVEIAHKLATAGVEGITEAPTININNALSDTSLGQARRIIDGLQRVVQSQALTISKQYAKLDQCDVDEADANNEAFRKDVHKGEPGEQDAAPMNEERLVLIEALHPGFAHVKALINEVRRLKAKQVIVRTGRERAGVMLNGLYYSAVKLSPEEMRVAGLTYRYRAREYVYEMEADDKKREG